MIWFEELAVGQTTELGAYTFTEQAILGFARAYDPQPFHLSEEAGRASLFGGLAASGWHTAAIFMKLFVAHMQARLAERRAAGENPVPELGPSPGFTDMKWLRPVLVGDTVAYRSDVTALKASASRPHWGIATSLHRGRNQRGEPVFEFTGTVFVPRRPV